MINVQTLAPNGASGFEVINGCIGLHSALDARAVGANDDPHSPNKFVQCHAKEIYLLAQASREVIDI